MCNSFYNTEIEVKSLFYKVFAVARRCRTNDTNLSILLFGFLIKFKQSVVHLLQRISVVEGIVLEKNLIVFVDNHYLGGSRA